MPTPAQRVAASADLRAALVASRAWGVSPSVFLGRDTTTTHVYDFAGRVVSTTTESQWNQDDRDLAVALMDWENDCCPGCGTPLAEAAAPENEEQYKAEVKARCHKCTALAQINKQVQERAYPSALLLGATLQTQGAHHADHLP